MSVNRIDATLTDDQRDRANAALVVLAKVPPFPLVFQTWRSIQTKYCLSFC
jgi:hypothetical protein